MDNDYDRNNNRNSEQYFSFSRKIRWGLTCKYMAVSTMTAQTRDKTTSLTGAT